MSAVAAAAAKTPFIDWAALVKVAGVSVVFGVGIVVLFSVGLVGVSWFTEPASASGTSPNKTVGAALAGICFAICAAAVLYGLYLIIPQFHK